MKYLTEPSQWPPISHPTKVHTVVDQLYAQGPMEAGQMLTHSCLTHIYNIYICITYKTSTVADENIQFLTCMSFWLLCRACIVYLCKHKGNKSHLHKYTAEWRHNNSRGAWVAQWLSVCLWLGLWSQGPENESHVGLPTGSLPLPLPVSLPFCLSWINE